MLANPESCQREYGEIRCKHLRHFPYSLFYAIETDRIRVLAVGLTAWSVFDLGVLSQSIMLAATERGLATMPAVTLVHYPDVLRSRLDIPDHLSIVFGIAIGYEDTQHPINKFKSVRRPLSDVAAIKGME